jgi:hypothetical protein
MNVAVEFGVKELQEAGLAKKGVMQPGGDAGEERGAAYI